MIPRNRPQATAGRMAPAAIGLGLLTALALLSGCASLGSSGPSAQAVNSMAHSDSRVRVVQLDAAVIQSVVMAQDNVRFARVLGDVAPRHGMIGAGDVLDISVWESPPAVLFGSPAPTIAGAASTTRATEFTSQAIDANGFTNLPFVGQVEVVGRAPAEVSREIAARLAGKAHDPQVIVRIAKNEAAGVTIVGDVATSRRMPLTTRNERVLDALAAAGGVRQPVDKVLIQITRGETVATRPLGAIIRDREENVMLADNDVVTALFQPYSFQALGALGANAEVPFEGTGITLAQALARIGGLQDNRANVKGVFIFRLEDPRALPASSRVGAPLTNDGTIPVIYRIDMSDPASFFAMQSFPMRDGDLLYAANAPAVDLQKFVGLVSQMAFSIVGVANSVN